MELLYDLESQISKTIEQKQSEVAKSTFCIYNVPQNLIETNGNEYYPQVVVIGPRHIGYGAVYVLENHKLEFLADLFLRKNLGFNELMESIRPLAKKARECYSNGMIRDDFFPHYNDDLFLKMMVVDGCFLIELFLKAAEKKGKDPLALIPRAVPYVYGDLLLLENQIPFFVLEELFTTIINKPDASETSKMPEESNASLSFLALRLFNKVVRRPDRVIEKFRKRKRATSEDQKPLHLLDLVRSTFIPTHYPDPPKNNEACCLIHSISKLRKRERAPSEDQKPLHLLDLVRSTFIPTHDPEPPKNYNEACRLIHSISKLRRAGIKLKLIKQADSFLDVKFSNGVIQMPNIILDHNMKTFLLNCVAFEYLHNSLSKHFTVYASFLDCLVDTTLDVGHLCESNILDSYFGNYDDVAQFINKMGKDLVFDDDQFYLSDLFKYVSDRYQSPCKVQCASFKNRYFNSPWSFISALAALVLLVLTLLQTFYTIYAYYVKSKP
ncbi:UPF0481 protein At3g47200-like [Corylus avellana]|uniref:UPF0481 protein At3g47200-like n=1 Tax=Corylus avellana TaxID=13451 RepID=UPI001E219F7E|nr:UPF0481 protein At3g47200-like [Corylus avellana]